MKKMIALMMALMFVLALAACSNGTKEPEAAPTAAAENNSSSGYTSSQGTIDGYDPNEKSDFVMNTSESTRTFNMGEADASQFSTPILVTSFGQSADASMMDAIMKKAGVADYTFNALATAEDVKNYKTVIIVCGASSKGLGAAGISESDETARAEAIMTAIGESKPAVIMCHLGGAIRRGALSDKLTDMVLDVANYLVVVEDANHDYKFSKFAEEKNVPLTFLYAIADGVSVFSGLFSK